MKENLTDEHFGCLGKSIALKKAVSPADFQTGKVLFKTYIRSLDFVLDFQDVDRELQHIDREYNDPEGVLLLAMDEGQAVGCIGVRKFDDGIAELKRMYVDPHYRGQQLGRRLLEAAFTEASRLGYRSIRLDTVPTMHSAIALYRSFGFREIDAYRFNPIAGALYMEKELPRLQEMI